MLSVIIVSIVSLFIGVIDVHPIDIITGDTEALKLFLISRLPRLMAILCTGVGMSVAGLIMQQLCMNKFVSPTTGATISSSQFGILIALLFMPNSTLWERAIFAFIFAILGTWIFVYFIQRIQFKEIVMVPLVGIMFENIIGGVTNFLAYKYEMTQALSTWLVGHFSMVLRGRYEIVYCRVVISCRRDSWDNGRRKNVINFDEEIKKFQPSLEVDEAEDAIYQNNTTDVTEVIDKIIREITDK